ncbi:MAG: DUF819 family protein [Alistipes sp.]|nr:DUF819 family protein [Alistipes sp.]
MVILNSILLILFYTLTPALVIHLCNRYKWIGAIGPIMVLYGIGILFGNISWMGEEMAVAQDIATSATIPLALPMMLFSSRFTHKEMGMQLMVVVSCFLSVAIAVVGGYLLLGHHMEEGPKVGGIISGMYTGGTPNAAAIQQMLSIEESTYTLINSYDIVISFLYFAFLFTVGIRLFRRLYGERTHVNLSDNDRKALERDISQSKQNPYQGIWQKSGLLAMLKVIAVTLGVVVISILHTLLYPEEWFMTVLILTLTTLSIALSFVRPIRELRYSYDMGMYLIYIFSLAIASMADFSNLDIAGGLYQLGFMTFAVFVSLTIHAILCRIMRINADSMVITSVAFINSPPFVPMAVGAMNNRKVLITGLSAGVIGYALGNYFGVLMAKLLSLL